jgi:hypothetical protein
VPSLLSRAGSSSSELLDFLSGCGYTGCKIVRRGRALLPFPPSERGQRDAIGQGGNFLFRPVKNPQDFRLRQEQRVVTWHSTLDVRVGNGCKRSIGMSALPDR